MLDDEFVANLPADPLLALKLIIAKSSEGKPIETDTQKRDLERRQIHLLALATVILRKYSMWKLDPPEMLSDALTNIIKIGKHFTRIKQFTDGLGAKELFQTALSAYERELDVGFYYEFSDGEIEKVQALINELREALGEAEYLDEDHRRRLLGRLEKLQAELHKRVSDFDTLLGVMAQIGAAAGRFGEDAKPLVDRVREIVNIAAGVFRRAEKLPPGPEFPSLPADE